MAVMPAPHTSERLVAKHFGLCSRRGGLTSRGSAISSTTVSYVNVSDCPKHGHVVNHRRGRRALDNSEATGAAAEPKAGLPTLCRARARIALARSLACFCFCAHRRTALIGSRAPPQGHLLTRICNGALIKSPVLPYFEIVLLVKVVGAVSTSLSVGSA